MVISISPPNFWYFFWILLSGGVFVGLYFLLKKKTDKTKKIVLFSILMFSLLLHFLKCFIPPYSTNLSRLYSDIWFINICAANILLFPFIFISKNKALKDYMFYIGVLSGAISLIYPMEPLAKIDQQAEILDIIRFYIHHSIIIIVPLLMVVLKLHRPSYKNAIKIPGILLAVLIFIILNQIFQSELGFVPLRDDNFFFPNYKNTSLIWGPGEHPGTKVIGNVLSYLCPNFFKIVPVGQHAGEFKHWPWFWLIVPAYTILTPICFNISLIFDFKSLKCDVATLLNKFKNIKKK